MRLKLSRAAEADLAEIRDYTIERFGIEQAVIYIDGLERAFRRIMDYPKSGEPADLHPDVRSVSTGDHRAYYRVGKDEILIVRILHKSMNAERRLG